MQAPWAPGPRLHSHPQKGQRGSGPASAAWGHPGRRPRPASGPSALPASLMGPSRPSCSVAGGHPRLWGWAVALAGQAGLSLSWPLGWQEMAFSWSLRAALPRAGGCCPAGPSCPHTASQPASRAHLPYPHLSSGPLPHCSSSWVSPPWYHWAPARWWGSWAWLVAPAEGPGEAAQGPPHRTARPSPWSPAGCPLRAPGPLQGLASLGPCPPCPQGFAGGWR